MKFFFFFSLILVKINKKYKEQSIQFQCLFENIFIIFVGSTVSHRNISDLDIFTSFK